MKKMKCWHGGGESCNRKVICSENQEGAVAVIASNVASIGKEKAKAASKDDEFANAKVINTDYYIM